MTHTDDTEVLNIQAYISRTTKHRETIFHNRIFFIEKLHVNMYYQIYGLLVYCRKNIWQKVTHRIKVNLLQAYNQPICYNRMFYVLSKFSCTMSKFEGSYIC